MSERTPSSQHNAVPIISIMMVDGCWVIVWSMVLGMNRGCDREQVVGVECGVADLGWLL